MKLPKSKDIHQRLLTSMRAFSLLELIVSMGIIVIILVMLHNVIITAAVASQKALARSSIREELATIEGLFAADVRSAERIVNCTGSFRADTPRSEDTFICRISGQDEIGWRVCYSNELKKLCRYNWSKSETTFINSDSLEVTSVIVDSVGGGFGGGNSNIVITLVGAHSNPSYEVNSVVRQSVVSTRNYTIF